MWIVLLLIGRLTIQTNFTFYTYLCFQQITSKMATQYVTDNKGNKLAVILPIKEYNRMIEELEDLDDIKLYDKAKGKKQEFIDAEQAFKEIEENRYGKDV